MHGQLAHLLNVAEQPNITILVIPYTTGPYFTDGNGPYTILDSARVGRRITAVETSLATMYLETPEANKRYADAWARIAARASGPEESLNMIRSLL